MERRPEDHSTRNLFDFETGADKLAELFVAKQKEGLTLFNYHGAPGDKKAISSWLAAHAGGSLLETET